MQKKIIALAIASAMTVPALAYAEATVYGQANISYDITDNGAATNGTSNWVMSNQSRIGVKGSEDLGDGLSAIWQMEGTIGMDAGVSGGVGNRNTFLGLKGNSWGTVQAGFFDTPYKSSTRKIDLFGDSAADNRAIMGTSLGSQANGYNQRTANTIAYFSPDMGGMSAAVSYATDEATEAGPQVSKLSLAGMYNAAGIYATVAYQSHDMTTNSAAAADTSDSALKIGGSYSMDAFTVGAVYEMTTEETAPALVITETKQNNLYLTGKFAISSTDAVKLAYTMGGDLEVGGTEITNSGATQLSVGYDHSMSKNTSVYALYTRLDRDLNAPGYTTYSGLTTTADQTSSVISFGMKHAF